MCAVWGDDAPSTVVFGNEVWGNYLKPSRRVVCGDQSGLASTNAQFL